MKKYTFKEQTLGNILEDKAQLFGESAFLQFEDNRAVSFREVNEMANKIANAFLNLGLAQGDKVATFLPNCLDAVYLWFGAAKAGLVEVPINTANKGNFLLHILNNCDATVLVVDRRMADRLKLIENDLHKLKTLILWSGTPSTEEIPALRFDLIPYEIFIQKPLAPPITEVQASDPQMIIYTSGTTGPAKGCVEPHAMIYLNASEYIDAIRATREDVFFTCLPMFHANARILAVYPALLLGTKVVIYERFSGSMFWEQIRKANATVFNSIGAIANFIYNQPRLENDGDNPVRICAAFPMPPAIYEDFEKRYQLKVVEGYGLSELAIITYNPFDQPKIGSCGKQTHGFKVMIVDENDFEVERGQLGEIVAQPRAPWSASLGYYNMPGKTLELTRNCIYHTGDWGYLDEDGFMYFMDRKKDYIRRRGENISSFEVERVVNAHPKIIESAAIGVQSEQSEDEVKVVIIPKEGEHLIPEELLAFCEERMPYFAVPRYVEFVTELPKTVTDRVQKNKLRECGITPTTWDREKAGYKVKR
ncbi:MAG: AMP-binding protein [Pseudomonadota bacterium]